MVYTYLIHPIPHIHMEDPLFYPRPVIVRLRTIDGVMFPVELWC